MSPKTDALLDRCVDCSHNPPERILLCGPTSVVRVRLTTGGYTPGRCGQYFGQGAPLYRADDESGEQRYLRASSRAEAVRLLMKNNPHMKARAS